MPSENNILLSVHDLKVYFYGNHTIARAVDGVSFDVFNNETVCLVGESGCGKTVSALSILGLVPSPPGKVEGGRVLFEDRDLLSLDEEDIRAVRGNRIAMVFQEPLTSLNPVFAVGDQIGEAIKTHKQVKPDELKERCIQLLKDTGIPSPEERLTNYPHELSGGQRQRVMIAMALACRPDLIIADEPTTALDVTIQAQILKLLDSIQKTGTGSVLYITHDLGVVANIADRVYVMYAGIIVEQGATSDLFNNPRHPYTRGLLASLPSRSRKGKGLYSIPGSVPDPAFKPAGCPFHPRCDLALESCEKELPIMYDFGKGQMSRCPLVYEQEG